MDELFTFWRYFENRGLKNVRKFIENKRNSKNWFWRSTGLLKDAIFFVIYRIDRQINYYRMHIYLNRSRKISRKYKTRDDLLQSLPKDLIIAELGGLYWGIFIRNFRDLQTERIAPNRPMDYARGIRRQRR